MNEDPLKKPYNLLKDFSTAMPTTMGGPDSCHARPMAIAKADENTDLWLFTSRDSEKVREIGADSRVQVHCQEGWTNCVVLTGRATVVADRAVIRVLLVGSPNTMATKKTAKSKKPGLYANIQAKKERIEKGSGETMRKKGAQGAPEADAFIKSDKTAKKK